MWWQCQVCGESHEEKVHFNIEDDLFILLQCKHCRGDTQHLYVGEHPDEVYIYGNCNLDQRYFNYKTIQND